MLRQLLLRERDLSADMTNRSIASSSGREHRVRARLWHVMLVAFALPSIAHADLVKDAESLAAGGDFVSAAARFREAYAREPSRPELLCNAGVAYYKASDLPRAHRYLTRCIKIGDKLDSQFMTNVQQVVAAVEQTLSAGAYTPVEITTQASNVTVAVAGGAPFDEPLLPGRVWFPRGSYELVASAPGFDSKAQTLDAEGTEAIVIELKLARTVARTTPDRRWIGYVVGGAGVAAMGAGVGFGAHARSLANEVHEECVDGCDWNRVAERDASGQRAQTLQYVLYGAGAIGLAAGVYLYVRGRPSKLSVTPHEGGGGVISWSRPW
jgi:hypothetical protein